MTYYHSWDEFVKAAEGLYLARPMKVRMLMKYRHVTGTLCVKVTDDIECILYNTDQAQDMKKIEKFQSRLMRLMVSRESRSAATGAD